MLSIAECDNANRKIQWIRHTATTWALHPPPRLITVLLFFCSPSKVLSAFSSQANMFKALSVCMCEICCGWEAGCLGLCVRGVLQFIMNDENCSDTKLVYRRRQMKNTLTASVRNNYEKSQEYSTQKEYLARKYSERTSKARLCLVMSSVRTSKNPRKNQDPITRLIARSLEDANERQSLQFGKFDWRHYSNTATQQKLSYFRTQNGVRVKATSRTPPI